MKIDTLINIVYYFEVIDNWGRNESSAVPERIIKVLQNPDEWSDDIIFQDSTGKLYFIDDLVGKEVQVGDTIFTVKE
jgi:hypothetical protein